MLQLIKNIFLMKMPLSFLKVKFTFKPVKKGDIIIYTYANNEYLFKFIEQSLKNNVNFIFWHEFNFFLFIKSLSKFIFDNKSSEKENFFQIYLRYFVKKSGAKVYISDLDNHKNFYTLGDKLNIKIILVQNGGRSYTMDVFETLKENEKYKVDDYVVFGENIGKYINKKINAKYHILGSYRLNYILANHKNSFFSDKRKNSITYISQYRVRDEHFIAEKQVIKFLDEFCFEKKINLYIHFASRDNKLYAKRLVAEKKYFDRLLRHSKAIYTITSNSADSYIELSKSDVIVNIDSSMGLEMLGLRKKVVHFSIRQDCKYSSFAFGWPGNYPKDGSSWCSYYSKEKFSSLLEKTLILKDDEWLKEIDIMKKDIFYQDLNFSNKVLSIIKQYI